MQAHLAGYGSKVSPLVPGTGTFLGLHWTSWTSCRPHRWRGGLTTISETVDTDQRKRDNPNFRRVLAGRNPVLFLPQLPVVTPESVRKTGCSYSGANNCGTATKGAGTSLGCCWKIFQEARINCWEIGLRCYSYARRPCSLKLLRAGMTANRLKLELSGLSWTRWTCSPLPIWLSTGNSTRVGLLDLLWARQVAAIEVRLLLLTRGVPSLEN